MSKLYDTVVIVGPTASGKSRLGLEIALECGAEIICADSRTLYKGLDVSTAKPTAQDRKLVPHHLLDILHPNEAYSAAQFKQEAKAVISDVHERGKLPMVIGGTGLYVDGLIFDYQFGSQANESLRQELHDKSVVELTKLLREQRIPIPENHKNKRYLIRALERGKSYSPNRTSIAPSMLLIGLAPSMQELTKRIEQRAENMLVSGGLEEAKWLYDTYGFDVPAAKAPFFKAYAQHIVEGGAIIDCQRRDVLLNRQLAKRQLTWFRRNRAIHWFDNATEAKRFIHQKLR